MHRFSPLPIIWGLVGCFGNVPETLPTDFSTIGHLRSRDGNVTIYSSATGPRYLVSDADGSPISDPLTEGELERRHPEFLPRIRLLLARVY